VFVFKSYGNAQVGTYFLNCIFGTIVPSIILVLRIIPSTRDFAKTISWVLRIIPSFSFGNGILLLGNK